MRTSQQEGKYHAATGLQLSNSRFCLDWLDELNIAPKVVLDIGSFDGGDAVRFFKRFGCETHSFEADPERYKVVQRSCDIFGIKSYHCGVSDVTGVTQFYPSINTRDPNMGAQGSLLKHKDHYKNAYSFIKQQEPVQIPCVRIDDFCSRNRIWEVDVAHIDVEGAELNVVKGFGEIRPTLVFAETILGGEGWEGSCTPGELTGYLKGLGYKLILDLGTDKLYRID